MNAKTLISRLLESPIYLDPGQGGGDEYYGDNAPSGRVDYEFKKLNNGELELMLKLYLAHGLASALTFSTVNRRQEIADFARVVAVTDGYDTGDDDDELIAELRLLSNHSLRGSFPFPLCANDDEGAVITFVSELASKAGVHVVRPGEGEVDFTATVGKSAIGALAHSYHLIDVGAGGEHRMQQIISARSDLGLMVALLKVTRGSQYLVFVPRAEFDKFTGQVAAASFNS